MILKKKFCNNRNNEKKREIGIRKRYSKENTNENLTKKKEANDIDKG